MKRTVDRSSPVPLHSQIKQILIDELQDTTASVYFLPDVYVFDLMQARFDNVGGMPVIAIRETPFMGLNGMIKRASDIASKFVGETERHIRLIFQRAREKASEGTPVIVFFDEMDSIFRTRGTGVSSDVETTVVPQLLAEIDGVLETNAEAFVKGFVQKGGQ